MEEGPWRYNCGARKSSLMVFRLSKRRALVLAMCRARMVGLVGLCRDTIRDKPTHVRSILVCEEFSKRGPTLAHIGMGVLKQCARLMRVRDITGNMW